MLRVCSRWVWDPAGGGRAVLVWAVGRVGDGKVVPIVSCAMEDRGPLFYVLVISTRRRAYPSSRSHTKRLINSQHFRPFQQCLRNSCPPALPITQRHNTLVEKFAQHQVSCDTLHLLPLVL